MKLEYRSSLPFSLSSEKQLCRERRKRLRGSGRGIIVLTMKFALIEFRFKNYGRILVRGFRRRVPVGVSRAPYIIPNNLQEKTYNYARRFFKVMLRKVTCSRYAPIHTVRMYIYTCASSRLGYLRRNYDDHRTVRYYDYRILVICIEFLPFFPPLYITRNDLRDATLSILKLYA